MSLGTGKTRRKRATANTYALGALCLGLVVVVLNAAPSRPSVRDITRQRAQIIRVGVRTWQATNRSSRCPTLVELVAEQILDPDTPDVDPWGRPYRFACEGNGVYVRSAGADGRSGTPDDITVP